MRYQARKPRYWHFLVLFVICLVLLCLPKRETIHLQGELVPEAKVSVVQALDIGTVDKVLTENGARVQAGEPVVEFASKATQTQLQLAQIQQVSLILSIQQLRNYLYPGDVDEVDGTLLEQQLVQYLTIDEKQLQTLYQQEKKRVAEQQQIRQQRIVALQEKDKRFAAELSQLATSSRTLDRRRHLQEQRLQVSGELNELIASLDAKVGDGLLTNLEQLISLRQQIAELQIQLQEMVVHAPIQGLVHNLEVAPGTEIKKGALLLELIPLGEPLLAEALMPAKEAVHFTPGDKAKLRVITSGYPKEAVIKGRVVHVAPLLQQDPQAKPLAVVKVALERQGFDYKNKHFELMPKLAVQITVTRNQATLFSQYYNKLRQFA